MQNNVVPFRYPVRQPSQGVARSLSFGTPSVKKEPAIKNEPNDIPTQTFMQVYLRVRPFNDDESARSAINSILPTKNPNLLIIKPKEPKRHPPSIRTVGHAKFHFSHILGPESTQENVFEKTTLSHINGLFNGLSAVVFAYGVTCSGKTWTIQGAPDNPGILPRALDVIINSIAMAKGHGLLQDANISDQVAALTGGAFETKRRPRALPEVKKRVVHDANYVGVRPNVDYKIFASYLEIYNEFCYDLFDSSNSGGTSDHMTDPQTAGCSIKQEPSFVLSEDTSSTSFISNPEVADVKPKRRHALKLKEDAQGEVYAEGQREVEIQSVADVEHLLTFGQQNRSVASTAYNERSSRSHSVFMITLKQVETIQQERGPDKTLVSSSKLHIVDLAGSEKTSKTANAGRRMTESRNINTSLMTLSRCLEALRYNNRAPQEDKCKKRKRIVPFRDSKLTRLLQHPLGSGAAVMIAAASPTLDDADETIHALRNATIAREIKTNIVQSRRALADLSNTTTEKQAQRTIMTRSRAMPLKERPPRPTRVGAPNNAVGKERRDLTETSMASWKTKYESLRKDFDDALKVLNDKLTKSNKEESLLKMELEEEIVARREVEKELTEVMKENERLFRDGDAVRDKLADAISRMRVTEIEIREAAWQEVEAIIKEMQERYESQIGELQERLDESDQPHMVITQTERRQTAERIARRLTRTSCAALQTIANNLREGSDDGTDEEYLQEDELIYEEEDEEEMSENETDNEINRDKE